MRGFFLFGLLFGFILSRAGATNPDAIAQMFLLQDFHLMIVISVAIIIAGVGLAIFRQSGLKSCEGKPLQISPKPRNAGNIWGGLLFGVGWALTGACPGTALSMLGEGKLIALFTLVGIFLGTALYRRTQTKPTKG